jgi:hypothetical protein
MKARKITALLSDELLQRAQRVTGKGIAPTIRRGLELLAASGAYATARTFRGKVRFSVRLGTLRQDR